MTVRELNVDRIIDGRPIGALQWRVVVICFLLAVIDGFDAASIGYVAPLLTEQFAIPPELMGQLLSAALVGLMLGAFVGSALADRLGRKPVIWASIIVMGVGSLMTASSSDTNDLFTYRFITGLGLGGVMPTINILTAEFAPERRRALLMTAMFTGLPLGTVVGGLASVGLLSLFGWEAVFLAGGILPLVMVPVVVFWLPESPRLMVLRSPQDERLAKTMRGLAPEVHIPIGSTFQTSQKPTPHSGVRALFADGRTGLTVLLWVVFFANLLTIFAMMGWLPSVLEASGFPLERAILASALLAVGGIIGGLAMALAIDRYGAIRSMTVGFLAASIIVSLIGYSTGSLPVLLIVLFFAGFTSIGCQFGLNAVASGSYDTNARATGLGWALGVGRLGSILGPIIVGGLLAMELGISTLFVFGALPMLAAAGAVFAIGVLDPKNNKHLNVKATRAQV